MSRYLASMSRYSTSTHTQSTRTGFIQVSKPPQPFIFQKLFGFLSRAISLIFSALITPLQISVQHISFQLYLAKYANSQLNSLLQALFTCLLHELPFNFRVWFQAKLKSLQCSLSIYKMLRAGSSHICASL